MKAKAVALPVLVDSGLSRYIEEVKKFPMLDEQEEFALAQAFKKNGDLAAAHKLVTSHLRLVVKMAMGFRGYGLPLVDLISEGNIGLMQAVKKFEPEKGFRLTTYAMWWIKAAINEYILRSWSLVKMGTSAAQKKLFFNLRRLKNKIVGSDSRVLAPSEISQVAMELDVPEQDVVEMDQRMSSSDMSLNAHVNDDSDSEYMDYLEDKGASQETILAENQDASNRHNMLSDAMSKLNERERDIIVQRRLSENPATLEDLSQKYGVSRERVRQIEERAIEKLRESFAV